MCATSCARWATMDAQSRCAPAPYGGAVRNRAGYSSGGGPGACSERRHRAAGASTIRLRKWLRTLSVSRGTPRRIKSRSRQIKMAGRIIVSFQSDLLVVPISIELATHAFDLGVKSVLVQCKVRRRRS